MKPYIAINTATGEVFEYASRDDAEGFAYAHDGGDNFIVAQKPTLIDEGDRQRFREAVAEGGEVMGTLLAMARRLEGHPATWTTRTRAIAGVLIRSIDAYRESLPPAQSDGRKRLPSWLEHLRDELSRARDGA